MSQGSGVEMITPALHVVAASGGIRS